MEKTSKVTLFLLFIISVFFGVLTPKVYADNNYDCENRYAVLVNPVRGKDLWGDKSLKPLIAQYNVSQKYKMPVTWLFQYDALIDNEIIKFTKSFTQNQEIGLFLEVSPTLARSSNVIYPSHLPWASPPAIFLSGYSQSERRRLIDTIFKEYKNKFNSYPTSIGAWWIDSYSLNYMINKYEIKTVMIVSDQKTTDNYGIWGQWWGTPYYPSKANILTPANDIKNKQNVVVIQWAQRDITKAYGEGFGSSNFSLQANDYLDRGLTTDYFGSLIDTYLSCKNKLSQITVGLETGIESSGFLGEYEKQLQTLSKIDELSIVSMKDFFLAFGNVYPDLVGGYILDDTISTWTMNSLYRENIFLGDRVSYGDNISFSDYFISDKSTFLKRYLPLENKAEAFKPWFSILVFLVISHVVIRTLGYSIYFTWCLSLVASFGLLIRSYEKFGWKVFYGPSVNSISTSLILLIVVTSLIAFVIVKYFKNSNLLYYFPLTFGLDSIVRLIKFTNIQNVYWLGFTPNPLRFVGIGISEKGLKLIDNNMSFEVASSILKIDYENLMQYGIFAFLIYPVSHIIIALILVKLMGKLSIKVKFFAITLLIFLLIVHILRIFYSDPLTVVPIS